MKNNRLLKIYLVSAFVSVVLFVLSFIIGWNVLDNMKDMYACTLPFLFTAVLSLAAFGFTPQTKAVRKVSRAYGNVVDISAVKGNGVGRNVNGCLRKIS